MKTLWLVPILFLMACQSVPESSLQINLKQGVATWKNPKNSHMKNLKARIGADGSSISVDEVSSTNDVDVVRGVLDANVQLSQNLLQALQAIAGIAAKAATTP